MRMLIIYDRNNSVHRYIGTKNGGFMTVHGFCNSSRISGRFTSLIRNMCVVSLLILVLPLTALCSPEKLVDSGDYKGKDFIKGCIRDYSDMVKGDDIDWVWISPGTVLANYKISIGTFENLAEDLRSSQVEGVKSTYKEILSKVKGDGKGVLSADMC